MKNITALVTLFCLMGLAGAQGSGLGDGYSSTQRAFFNEPITSTFEPYVNNYWSNYVVGNKSRDEALEYFKELVTTQFPDITVE